MKEIVVEEGYFEDNLLLAGRIRSWNEGKTEYVYHLHQSLKTEWI